MTLANLGLVIVCLTAGAVSSVWAVYVALGLTTAFVFIYSRDLESTISYLCLAFILHTNDFLGYSYGQAHGGGKFMASDLMYGIPFFLVLYRGPARRTLSMFGAVFAGYFLVMAVDLALNIGDYPLLKLLSYTGRYVACLLVYFVVIRFSEQTMRRFVGTLMFFAILAAVFQILGTLRIDSPLRPWSATVYDEGFGGVRHYQIGNLLFVVANLISFSELVCNSRVRSRSFLIRFAIWLFTGAAILAGAMRSVWAGILAAYLVMLFTLVARSGIRRIPVGASIVVALSLALTIALFTVGSGSRLVTRYVQRAVTLYETIRKVAKHQTFSIDEDSTLTQRLIVYRAQYEQAKERPLTGIGLLPEIRVGIASQSEFAFFDVFFKFGWSGVFLFLALVVGVFSVVWSRRCDVGSPGFAWCLNAAGYMAAAIVSGFGVNLFSLPESMAMVAVIVGLQVHGVRASVAWSCHLSGEQAAQHPMQPVSWMGA